MLDRTTLDVRVGWPLPAWGCHRPILCMDCVNLSSNSRRRAPCDGSLSSPRADPPSRGHVWLPLRPSPPIRYRVPESVLVAVRPRCSPLAIGVTGSRSWPVVGSGGWMRFIRPPPPRPLSASALGIGHPAHCLIFNCQRSRRRRLQGRSVGLSSLHVPDPHRGLRVPAVPRSQSPHSRGDSDRGAAPHLPYLRPDAGSPPPFPGRRRPPGWRAFISSSSCLAPLSNSINRVTLPPTLPGRGTGGAFIAFIAVAPYRCCVTGGIGKWARALPPPPPPRSDS